MTYKIAFNPEDRFVVGIGSTLIVTTQDGNVFGHDVLGHRTGEAFKFSGARAAFNGPQDRFVVTIGNKLIVITQSGDVFGHEVAGRDIGPAFKFTGSRAAFNGVHDRFVVTIGNKLIVITQSGDVFGHEVAGRDVGPAFKFTGSKAAFNGVHDRFVVTVGNKLIVTTQSGDVFGHEVSGRDIGPPFKFTGSRMAFNPQDRFVLTVGNMMIVTTQRGPAFGADVSGRDIGPIFLLNPNDAVSVSLNSLKCYEQEDTEPPIIDTEDDEPYVLVMSINGQGRGVGPGGVVQLPESRVFRVGPIEGFDEDDLKAAPANALWGLNPPQAGIPEPALILDIDQVFFLVALLENDNAAPAQVQNRIVAFAQAGLPGLWLAAQARNELDARGRFDLFVETARSAMEGVIDLARLNPLDPDDKIGPVQVLRFSGQEHQGVLNASIPVAQRTLRFQGDDADYELTFGLKVA